MPDGSAVIVRELHIDAAPALVFAYFTDPDKLITWKAVSAQLDARPGGSYRMDVTGRGDVAIGSYLEVDPPHRIVFTLSWEGAQPAAPPGVVEVSLLPDGRGTWLRLVHRGLDPGEQGKSTQGWQHYLDRLALVARGEDPGPDPWAAPASQQASLDSGR